MFQEFHGKIEIVQGRLATRTAIAHAVTLLKVS